MSIEYDIIVPNYVTDVSLAIVTKCLQSVRQFSSNYRLILIDNASPAFSRLKANLYAGATVVINQENVGFVKAVNQGLRLSTAPYVVILNNDTVVVSPWLERMRAEFQGAVGLVGPRSQPNGTISGLLPYRRSTILPVGSMLVFFCVMISRAVLDKVGCLDEEFGVGLGDDDEYCYRAQQAGFELCFLGDLVILHHHKVTFRQLYSGKDIAQMSNAARALLNRKIGISDPAPPPSGRGKTGPWWT